ncbi:hypothetical protein NDN01_17925 [Sphingomonas sp. QA11]|uniref:hypothetical protein n=1 Tax=Sphingomonas sp. QA11 TaxID=2950605 RepID=UPI002349BA14|nr:hypothetical protein [Sphingomonas sp. QA11]WCM25891.1 hypothetical protein NDN01_17925 [Sphingomonas sp. QA11]
MPFSHGVRPFRFYDFTPEGGIAQAAPTRHQFTEISNVACSLDDCGNAAVCDSETALTVAACQPRIGSEHQSVWKLS